MTCFHTAPTFVDSIWQMLGPMVAGVPCLVLPPEVSKNPTALLQALEDHGVTHIVAIPTLLSILVPHMERSHAKGEPSSIIHAATLLRSIWMQLCNIKQCLASPALHCKCIIAGLELKTSMQSGWRCACLSPAASLCKSSCCGACRRPCQRRRPSSTSMAAQRSQRTPPASTPLHGCVRPCCWPPLECDFDESV